ncbi:MAG: MerR family transcriptional regulator [Gaiella sp.]
MGEAAFMRIGELARRTGVSPELLRAWERRYGLLHPARSPGGFRLYSTADVERIRMMQALIDDGLSAAQAAELAARGAAEESRSPTASGAALLEALLAFDDAAANDAFDRLLADVSLESVLRDAVLPILRELGERWERGETTVAQEHFASSFIRGRLLGLARGWDRGVGPRVLLAAPSEEHHDLAMIVFGLALRQHGWRVTSLGTDTPLHTLAEAASALDPQLVVVAAAIPERLAAVADELTQLARERPVAIAGRGATPELAIRTGTQLLRDDPFDAAARLAAPPRTTSA